MDAQNAKQQHQAMLDLMERGMALPVFQRFAIAADLMAAQITFNGFTLEEIDRLAARLDLSDRRRAKAIDLANSYFEKLVSTGAVPADVVDELQRNLAACDSVDG